MTLSGMLNGSRDQSNACGLSLSGRQEGEISWRPFGWMRACARNKAEDDATVCRSWSGNDVVMLGEIALSDRQR